MFNFLIALGAIIACSIGAVVLFAVAFSTNPILVLAVVLLLILSWKVQFPKTRSSLDDPKIPRRKL